MSIQHTVVFRLAHEAGSSAETEFLSTARTTLTAIPGVTEFTINRQVNPKSDLVWQFSMVFTAQAADDAHNTHPEHARCTTPSRPYDVAASQEYHSGAP